MAAELTADIAVTFNDVEDSTPSAIGLTINTVGTRYVKARQTIGTSEEALGLGDLAGATLGVFVVKNLSLTNYVEIRSGTGAGNDIVKLLPGECWAWRWGSDVTAPYAIANTNPVLIEFRIHEA